MCCTEVFGSNLEQTLAYANTVSLLKPMVSHACYQAANTTGIESLNPTHLHV
jgi:hypothetical protein